MKWWFHIVCHSYTCTNATSTSRLPVQLISFNTCLSTFTKVSPLFSNLCLDSHFCSGPDHARVQIRDASMIVNEIDNFWQAQYLSAGEATWCILDFHLTTKEPAINALPIHTDDHNLCMQYVSRHKPGNAMTKLDHYFVCPCGSFHNSNKRLRSFDDLTYHEYYELFHLEKCSSNKTDDVVYYVECPNTFGLPIMSVIHCTSNIPHITCIHPMSPSHGETFFICSLLLTKPARSFEHLRTVDGKLFPTFQEATAHIGLFHDKAEDVFCLSEAVASLYTPRQLRSLFVNLLTNNCCHSLCTLWSQF